MGCWLDGKDELFQMAINAVCRVFFGPRKSLHCGTKAKPQGKDLPGKTLCV